MFETFFLALCSLVVVLYLQARFSARRIRRNREETGRNLQAEIALKRRI